MELSEKARKAFLKKLGNSLERLIYEKFNNKKHFSEMTGIHRQKLHDMLTGARDTRISTLKTVAAHLGVKVKDLLADED
jgi:DNA-binding Xre family transcriptional regulator